MTTVLVQRGLLTLTSERLRADFWPHGGMRWLTAPAAGEDLLVNLHPASGLEPGPANLWLRRRDGAGWLPHPLLGPASGSVVDQDDSALEIAGSWDGLHYRAVFELAPTDPGWRWSVTITRAEEGQGHEPTEVDLVWTQDVGLAGRGVVRSNELYVSQYLDITPLVSRRVGTVLAVRQNQPQDGRHPWLLLGSDRHAERFATDARQLFDLSYRNGEPAVGLCDDLPSVRLQHEHSVVGLQTERAALAPGDTWRTGFFGHLVDDHAASTGPDDLIRVDRALGSLPAPAVDLTGPVSAPTHAGTDRSRTVFSPARLWRSDHLTEADVAAAWGAPRLPERDGAGRLLSFFTDDGRHVVLAAKEQRVLRPHGRLLRAGDGLLPDPEGLAVTTWMTGSPLSYLTRGHASADRVLSTVRGYLGWHRAYGLRVFVQRDHRWLLLDQPSAHEMGLDQCRWLYRSGEHEIVITTTMPLVGHRVEVRIDVTAGPPQTFLLALGLAEGDDGLEVGPADADVLHHQSGTRLTIHHPTRTLIDVDGAVAVGDDGPLFGDGRPRGLRWLSVTSTARTGIRIQVGHREAEPELWPALRAAVDFSGGADPAGLAPVAAALPWVVSDAMTHYLSPRGLEQYTGGAWGTRDVSQGPVELLLGLGRTTELREVLTMIMAAQHPSGEWPQAFGFLPGDRLRLGPPHGDVILWPVLAVGRYLLATGDGAVLDEVVSYADTDGGPGGTGTVDDHLRRAVDLAADRVLPGTHLTAYGHGDWNDSLQPADPRLAAELTSAWTVTLHHQALSTLADGLQAAGRTAWVQDLRRAADVIAGEFADHLMPVSPHDGGERVVAGYARFVDGRPTGHLLHPTDTETGLRYSVLPMVHAIIAGLLTPDQARTHLVIIDEHLRGADGIRLFDAPPTYRGGRTVHFQRAETATFVGREIGLMYTHAQLRYLEAVALLGHAEDLWRSLRQVINVDVAAEVPNARPRQANCYASSSDAVVADRVAFADGYDAVLSGEIGVEAGWRVYSSGPGIIVRVVRECLLGLRLRAGGLEVDPVLTDRFDGAGTTVEIGGRRLAVRYRMTGDGSRVSDVRVAGASLPARRLSNPYRPGGVLLGAATLAAIPADAELEVVLS